MWNIEQIVLLGITMLLMAIVTEAACPENCKTETACNSDNLCIGCKVGFSGSECQYSCNDRCNRRGCKQYGGHSCIGCDDGYWGNLCQYDCPTHCKENSGCTKVLGHCFTCENGYWDDDTCDRRCSNNCGGGTCAKANGFCYPCNEGYWGDQCRQRCQNCKSTCSQSNGRCHTCASGYWGDDCQSTCIFCINGCSRNNGACAECKSGYWGSGCQNLCAEKCKGACTKSEGNCMECKTSNWGSKCENECDVNCKNACHMINATCLACKHGYWGDKCETECDVNCKDACDKSNGNCLECQNGRWGDTCEKECSPSCNGTCDQTDAKCEDCNDGYWGDTCINECPKNCEGQCLRTDGTCVSCKVNWGETCNDMCHVNCKGECLMQNGTCANCKNEPTWGDNCTQNCPSNCNGTCDRWNGYCGTCISNAFYTNTCETQCPEHCDAKGCMKESGQCFDCDNGYYGKNCSQKCGHCASGNCNQSDGTCPECASGYYGDTCDSICSNCDGGLCNKTTGICNTCANGYWAENCNSTCYGNCARCDRESGVCIDCLGYFGENCTEKCPDNCFSNECNKANGMCDSCMDGYYGLFCNKSCATCLSTCDGNGKCIGGCQAGWTGDTCEQSCASGSWGESCSGTCNCADDVPCDAVSGMCPDNQCADGWEGPLCQENQDLKLIQPDKGSPGSSHSIPLLGGAVGGGVVVLVIVVLVAALLVRWRRNKKPDNGLENNLHDLTLTSTSSQQELINGHATGNHPGNQETVLSIDADDEDNDNDVDDVDDDGMSIDDEPLTVAVSPLNSQCETKSVKLRPDQLQHHMSSGELTAEYLAIPGGKEHPWKVADRACNKIKNRYKGIWAYDHSRVILNSPNDGSDYINANYLPGYREEKAFIAAQGATEHTVQDVWRMIWQEGVRVIVMTTKLKEGKKTKCEKYWPDVGKSAVYGDLTVLNETEQDRGEYVIRKLALSKGSSERVIRHFHYTGWPDHDVPDSAATLLTIRQQVIQAKRDTQGEYDNRLPPVLVHCSAGIGRTGTYISLDYLLDQAEQEGVVDVAACIRTLRKQRTNMVQNMAQYRFIYQAIYDGIFIGPTHVNKDNVNIYTADKIDTQHQVLQQEAQGESPPNRVIVNSQSLLPILPSRAFHCDANPEVQEIQEFWNGILEKRISTIVFLTSGKESADGHHLLPRTGSLITLESGVQITAPTDRKDMEGGMYSMELSVTAPEDREYANVAELKKDEQTYANMADWQQNEMKSVRVIVMDSESLSDFMAAWKQLSDNTSPILISSSTLDCSCMFAVCMLLLDHTEAYGEADVFDAVRKLRTKHGDVINKVADYSFLYKVLQVYYNE